MGVLLPALLGGGAMLGGILGGRGERPTIDPAQLRELFGPQALAGDTQELYRLLANSPAFSAIMNRASLQGSQLAQRSQANLASRGISGSGIGGFLGAAGQGLGGQLQMRGQSQLFGQALQAAMRNLSERQSLFGQSFLTRQEQPTFGRMIGGSLFAGGQNVLKGLKF